MKEPQETTPATIDENTKQSLALKPRVVVAQAFHYRGFKDLKNLIQFVGSRPIINEHANKVKAKETKAKK